MAVFPFITPANPNPPLPPSPTLSPPPPAHLAPSDQDSLPPSTAASSASSAISIDLEKGGVIGPVTDAVRGGSLSAILDKAFGPKNGRICGFRRNTFIMIIAAVTYLFLGGIVSIAVVKGTPQKGAPQPQVLGDTTGENRGDIAETPEEHTSPKASGHGNITKDDDKDTTNLPLPDNTTIFSGDGTYYNPAMGSCGIESTDNDAIVAISHVLYDAASKSPNPNLNPLCGKKVRATRFNAASGKTVTVEATVTDRCVGCKRGDLDFSPYLFKKLASTDDGRVDIKWAFI